MPDTANLLAKKVAYILHVGCVELRNLALGERPHHQLAELADAMEILPRYLVEGPTPGDWKMVQFVVTNYNKQYPDSGWRLVQCLDYDPPEQY